MTGQTLRFLEEYFLAPNVIAALQQRLELCKLFALTRDVLGQAGEQIPRASPLSFRDGGLDLRQLVRGNRPAGIETRSQVIQQCDNAVGMKAVPLDHTQN